jgi:tryptophan halogenase
VKNVKNLTVVGGGTAGLIAALILKERSNLDVSIVYSSKIGIVGVGEGSTEHFKSFMDFVGITGSEIVKECDATFKIGVMFDDWIKDKKYLHTVVPPFSNTIGQYTYVYAKQISENSNYIYSNSVVNNKVVATRAIDINNTPETNQYHFNTFKLNDFLKKKAIEKGIKVFDDDIIDVKLDENGFIDFVIGENSEYKSDFYIDATGFKRILMNKLNVKWKSYSKYLKLNSAITFPTEDEDNYNFWTLAKAMDAGWRFKIPTWGRHGNGYIYDKNFITAEEAKLEVEKELGHTIEIGKTFEFDPGALENVWTKNCVAMGLSGCFFEPLEATSIGLTIQQSFLLMHRLQNYDENVIKDYNKSFNTIVDNIRDFIMLHYLSKRNDTDFWKSILDVELPDSLRNNLEKWKTKLPIKEDFIGDSNYAMFNATNFTVVMSGLNLFDNDAILQEYSFSGQGIKDNADIIINSMLFVEEEKSYLNHKEVIKIIRDIGQAV